jgi:hypothetical protein
MTAPGNILELLDEQERIRKAALPTTWDWKEGEPMHWLEEDEVEALDESERQRYFKVKEDLDNKFFKNLAGLYKENEEKMDPEFMNFITEWKQENAVRRIEAEDTELE